MYIIKFIYSLKKIKSMLIEMKIFVEIWKHLYPERLE